MHFRNLNSVYTRYILHIWIPSKSFTFYCANQNKIIIFRENVKCVSVIQFELNLRSGLKPKIKLLEINTIKTV